MRGPNEALIRSMIAETKREDRRREKEIEKLEKERVRQEKKKIRLEKVERIKLEKIERKEERERVEKQKIEEVKIKKELREKTKKEKVVKPKRITKWEQETLKWSGFNPKDVVLVETGLHYKGHFGRELEKLQLEGKGDSERAKYLKKLIPKLRKINIARDKKDFKQYIEVDLVKKTKRFEEEKKKELEEGLENIKLLKKDFEKLGKKCIRLSRENKEIREALSLIREVLSQHNKELLKNVINKEV